MRFVFEIIDNFEDLLKELKSLMFDLDFKNNFKSFTVEDLKLTEEAKSIPNALKPQIPSGYLILEMKETTGNPLIVKPTEKENEWTLDNVFLKTSNGTATVKVVFLR